MSSLIFLITLNVPGILTWVSAVKSPAKVQVDIDIFEQDCNNSNANALELL